MPPKRTFAGRFGLLCAVFSLLLPVHVAATDPQAICGVPPPQLPDHVVVNEFMPNPSSGSDCVELFNSLEVDVSIAGWTIDDSEPGSPRSIAALSIPAGALLVVEVSTILNKTGDMVRLLDAGGNEIDAAQYSSSSPNESYSRLPDGSGAFAATSASSRGMVNRPTVLIDELAAFPGDGSAAWIELPNRGPVPAELAGFMLDDQANGAAGHLIIAGTADETTLAPGAITIFELPADYFATTDEVRLLAPNGDLRDSLAFQNAGPGTVLGRDVADAFLCRTDLVASPCEPNRRAAAATPTANPLLAPTTTHLPATTTPTPDALSPTPTPTPPGAVLQTTTPLPTPVPPSATPTPTATATSSPTATNTATTTPTPTRTPLPTRTPSPTREATPTRTPSPTREATPPRTPSTVAGMASTAGSLTNGEPGAILFAQVMYDPDTTGAEADLEWFTLFNTAAQSIKVHGWTLRDSKSATLIPTFELPAHSLALLAPSDATRHALPNFDGVWVLLDGRIGNGLGDSGDQLSLRDGAGNLIDALSWGDDTAVFDPAVRLTAPGTPLSRQLPRDTDTADDWQAEDEQGTSETAPITLSDERSSRAVSVTHSEATAPGSSPADPSAGRLILSEVAAGRAWIELYNPTGDSVDPSGWSIIDDDPNSPPLALPLLDDVDAYSFALIDDPKLHTLSGGVLRLLRPDGTIADTLAATDIAVGTIWSRYPVQGGAWQPGTPPSPGTFKLAAAAPTPTTRPTTTPTPATLANPDAAVAERHAMTASGPRSTVAGLGTRTALAGIGLGAALALLIAVYAAPRRRAPADFDAGAASGTDDSDRE